MGNNHYRLDGELEVSLKVKVNNIAIHNFKTLSHSEQRDALEQFKKNITKELEHKLNGSHYNDDGDLSDNVQIWSFDIE